MCEHAFVSNRTLEVVHLRRLHSAVWSIRSAMPWIMVLAIIMRKH
jgi:hypothetical protein